MSEFVRIQSTKTITVTCGLDFQDFTNADAHIPDRLKVSPTWPKATVLIREGVGNYPAQILEWPTVQALVKDNILTVGEKVEKVTDEAMAKAEELELNLEEIRPKRKSRKKKLEEIAEETSEEVPEEIVEE